MHVRKDDEVGIDQLPGDLPDILTIKARLNVDRNRIMGPPKLSRVLSIAASTAEFAKVLVIGLRAHPKISDS